MEYNPQKILYGSLFVFMLVGLITLGFVAVDYRDERDVAQDLNNEVVRLLEGYEAGIEGQTCVILSQTVAEDILGTPVTKSIGSRQIFAGATGSQPGAADLYWSDACIYEDPSDSNRYVELYVSTYKTPEQAKDAFGRILPVVNEAEQLDPGEYGETFIYDARVAYVLNDREIIQVAASNGDASFMAKEFTLGVLERLAPQL